MHPAAAVEVRSTQRLRARVHVEPHPAMPDLTTLTFLDGHGTEYGLTFGPEDLALLAELVNARCAQTGLNVVEVRSA